MPKTNKPTLTDEQKFAIADVITSNCNPVSPDTIQANKKFYFRDIINSSFKLNGKVDTIANLFKEDDATHITNLVINRMSAPKLVRTVGSMEVK